MTDGKKHFSEPLAFCPGEEVLGWEFTEDDGGGDHVEENETALFQIRCAGEAVGGLQGGEGDGKVCIKEVVPAEVVRVGAAVGFGVEVQVGGD